MTEVLQGWCSDPYGRHEARWMSDGKPTDLVRDGVTESSDPLVAGEAPRIDPVPLQQTAGEGVDLKRADDPLAQLSAAADDETMRDRRPVAYAATFGTAGLVLGFLGSIAFGVAVAHAAFIGVLVGVFAALGSLRPRSWD